MTGYSAEQDPLSWTLLVPPALLNASVKPLMRNSHRALAPIISGMLNPLTSAVTGATVTPAAVTVTLPATQAITPAAATLANGLADSAVTEDQHLTAVSNGPAPPLPPALGAAHTQSTDSKVSAQDIPNLYTHM